MVVFLPQQEAQRRKVVQSCYQRPRLFWSFPQSLGCWFSSLLWSYCLKSNEDYIFFIRKPIAVQEASLQTSFYVLLPDWACEYSLPAKRLENWAFTFLVFIEKGGQVKTLGMALGCCLLHTRRTDFLLFEQPHSWVFSKGGYSLYLSLCPKQTPAVNAPTISIMFHGT